MSLHIEEYIRPGRRAHLVGIGGVSMSPLGEVLHGAGAVITGSDARESAATEHLRSLGIPVFERAQAWGAIMRSYQNALCVAGTHGKTTTTSMCTHIFLAAGRDPAVMIGGTLPILGAGHRVGRGDTIILESCEYCNSFLSFFPTVAVILNVDADHLDFFKDLDDVKRSFRAFAQLVPDRGCVVADRDDGNTMDALDGLDRPLVTFGLVEGDVHSANLTYQGGFGRFDIISRGQRFAHAELSVPGVHNVRNALAAAAAAIQLGVPARAVEEGLNAFHGAGRRFEPKGEYAGAKIYDDYAHHPQELLALLTTVKTLGYRRVICAFQPHTYSRTKELFDDFAEVLKLPDLTVLAEALYCPTLEEVTRQLAQLAQPGDLILTVGAGDIYLAGEALAALEG